MRVGPHRIVLLSSTKIKKFFILHTPLSITLNNFKLKHKRFHFFYTPLVSFDNFDGSRRHNFILNFTNPFKNHNTFFTFRSTFYDFLQSVLWDRFYFVHRVYGTLMGLRKYLHLKSGYVCCVCTGLQVYTNDQSTLSSLRPWVRHNGSIGCQSPTLVVTVDLTNFKEELKGNSCRNVILIFLVFPKFGYFYFKKRGTFLCVFSVSISIGVSSL